MPLVLKEIRASLKKSSSPSTAAAVAGLGAIRRPYVKRDDPPGPVSARGVRATAPAPDPTRSTLSAERAEWLAASDGRGLRASTSRPRSCGRKAGRFVCRAAHDHWSTQRSVLGDWLRARTSHVAEQLHRPATRCGFPRCCTSDWQCPSGTMCASGRAPATREETTRGELPTWASAARASPTDRAPERPVRLYCATVLWSRLTSSCDSGTLMARYDAVFGVNAMSSTSSPPALTSVTTRESVVL